MYVSIQLTSLERRENAWNDVGVRVTTSLTIFLELQSFQNRAFTALVICKAVQIILRYMFEFINYKGYIFVFKLWRRRRPDRVVDLKFASIKSLIFVSFAEFHIKDLITSFLLRSLKFLSNRRFLKFLFDGWIFVISTVFQLSINNLCFNLFSISTENSEENSLSKVVWTHAVWHYTCLSSSFDPLSPVQWWIWCLNINGSTIYGKRIELQYISNAINHWAIAIQHWIRGKGVGVLQYLSDYLNVWQHIWKWL